MNGFTLPGPVREAPVPGNDQTDGPDDVTVTLTADEASALLDLFQCDIADGMNSRRDSCYWCGADLTERDHERDCTMPLVLAMEERLTAALGAEESA